MNSLPTNQPGAVPGGASPQLKRLLEEPVTAVQAAQDVLRTIARLERWNAASPAETLAAVRWQLEGIATDRAGQLMRQLQEWEARQ